MRTRLTAFVALAAAAAALVVGVARGNDDPAGVGTEIVGQFTTYYEPGQPRVTNIRRAAQLLDGTVLEPGERFSMNTALGRRTRARGFVPAPMISGGVLVPSVGGGISQVATTLYNAAFFSGLRIVEHRPHSFWISRYPKGREATISWGGPELIFQNDWAAKVVMRLRTTRTSITVTFQSQKLGRRVTSVTSKPYAYVAPRTRYVKDPTLPRGSRVVVQSAGGSGFSVDYTRKVYRDGALRRNERYHVRYDAVDEVIAVSGR